MTIDPSTATTLTLKQAIGVLRFAAESHAPGHQAYAMALAELERLQAMERRLEALGEELERYGASGRCSVSQCIAEELRNRMRGDR